MVNEENYYILRTHWQEIMCSEIKRNGYSVRANKWASKKNSSRISELDDDIVNNLYRPRINLIPRPPPDSNVLSGGINGERRTSYFDPARNEIIVGVIGLPGHFGRDNFGLNEMPYSLGYSDKYGLSLPFKVRNGKNIKEMSNICTLSARLWNEEVEFRKVLKQGDHEAFVSGALRVIDQYVREMKEHYIMSR